MYKNFKLYPWETVFRDFKLRNSRPEFLIENLNRISPNIKHDNNECFRTSFIQIEMVHLNNLFNEPYKR